MILILHSPAILYIEYLLGSNILFGALSAIVAYYSLYEYLHYCMHIPKRRWLEKTVWFRWLDSHHHMHHKRHFNNLNVVDRKSTRLNSSHVSISYAVFCL